MSRIVVLGEPPRVEAWALAGVLVLPAVGTDAVRRAWDAMPSDVEVVVATADAARALGLRSTERLLVVLP